jgi:hypothetical protein
MKVVVLFFGLLISIFGYSQSMNDDKKLIFGLLYTMLDDSTTRYEYMNLNPKISNLLIYSTEGVLDDKCLLPFCEWVEILPVMDKKYTYVYNYEVYSKDENGDVVSEETIVYYGGYNQELYKISLTYVNDNLKTIIDFNILYDY